MSNRTVRFIIAKLNNFSEIILVMREDIQLSVITALKKRQRRRQRRRPTADVVQSVAALKTTKQDDFDFGNREGGGGRTKKVLRLKFVEAWLESRFSEEKRKKDG